MKSSRSTVTGWFNALAPVLVLAAGLGCPVLADERTEYFHVAGLLSFDYDSTSGKSLPVPTIERLGAIETKAANAAVRRAAEVVAFGLRAEEKEREAVAHSIAELKAQAKEMLASGRVGNGRRIEYYTDRDDFSGKLVTKSVEVDDGYWSREYCMSLLETPDHLDAEQIERRRQHAFLKSLVAAWDELLPGVPDKFAGKLRREPLVSIKVRGGGPRGQPGSTLRQHSLPFAPNEIDTFAGRHVATNVADRDLNNVTMLVELFHYSTLAEPCARHVYYVPKWEKGGSIELSRQFMLDFKRGGKNYRVTNIAKQPNEGQLSELTQLAGVVRIRVSVWADEARQKDQTVELSERAEVVAGELVKQAEFVVKSPFAVTSNHVRVESPISKDIRQKMEAPAKARGEQERSTISAEQITNRTLDQLLKPVVDFMPADSDLARRANRLLTDFMGEREKLLGRDDQSLLDACAEGRRYIGSWSGPSHPLGLLFVSRDRKGKQIWAEMFDPSRPQFRRQLRGELGLDRKTQKTILVLQPPSERRQQLGPTSSLLGLEILSDDVRTYRLSLEDGQLAGAASQQEIQFAGYDPSTIKFRLHPSEPDANELAEAQKRKESPVAKGHPSTGRGSNPGNRIGSSGSGKGAQPEARGNAPIPGRPPMRNRSP